MSFDWGGLNEAAWRSAVMLVPIVAIIALLCRCFPVRPVTRHALWLGAIAWLCIGPWLPSAPTSPQRLARLFSSGSAEERVAPDLLDRQLEMNEAELVDEPGITEFAAEPELAPVYSSRKITKTGWLEKAWMFARNRFLAGLNRWRAAPLPHADVVELETYAVRAAASPRERLTFEPPANESADVSPLAARLSPTTGSTGPTESVLTGLVSFGKRFIESLSAWTRAAWRSVQAIITWPALPGEWWLAGMCLVTALQAVSLLRFRARLGSASPADADTRELIRTTASELGLRHIPRIGMIDARVSPMVWCLGRPHLLLPTELWSQLDEVGRRAVVLHELAHLRRRDHWVRRLETLAGAAYWWHPLVWAIRARLNEEADLCCDQWVTALLPNGRATYARALLETKRFVGDRAGPMPAAAIGAISGRFTRFSRRLTMIMTDTHSPRRSMGALAVVIGLIVSGWLATPAFSGDTPPAPPAPVAPEAVVAAVPNPEVAVVAEAARAALVASNDDRDIEKRMERLERQMSELMSKLDRMGVGGGPAPRLRVRVPSKPRVARAPRAAGAEGVIGKNYCLPDGKLKALSALMIRDDVPIKVAPGDGTLTVYATAEQHEHFEAFIEMINPDADEGDDDGDDDHDNDHAHAPRAHGLGAGFGGYVIQNREQMKELRSKLQKLRHEFKMKGEKSYRKAIIGSMHRTAKEMGKQAEALERAADSLERKSQELREKADKIRQSKEGGDETMSHAADEITEQAEAVQAQAEAARTQMEEIQDFADAAQDEADQMEEQMAAGDEGADEDENAEG